MPNFWQKLWTSLKEGSPYGYVKNLADGDVTLSDILGFTGVGNMLSAWSDKSYDSDGNFTSPGASSIGSLANDLTGISANNEFTAQQNQLDREFNSAEAQKERDWQTEMSNTSYQRAVADMQAAGLNPASISGVGATSSSGASASSHGGGASGSGGLGQILSFVATLYSASSASQAKTNAALINALSKKK